MVRKKKKYQSMFLTIVSLISAISIPVYAGTGRAIIADSGENTVILGNDFHSPGKLPVSQERAEEYAEFYLGQSGWSHAYYAEGTGLELCLLSMDDDNSVFAATIYDYHKGGYQLEAYDDIRMAQGDTGLAMTRVDENTLQCEFFTLTKDGNQIRMDLSENYPDVLYRDTYTYEYDTNGEMSVVVTDREFSSIMFTDILTLMNNPKDDLWGGSWGYSVWNEHPEADGYESYICLQQIYGTRDYVYGSCTWNESYGMSDWEMTMYESDEEKLFSFYNGPGELNPESIYLYHRKNSDGELMYWDFAIQESMLDYDEDDYPAYAYTYLTSGMLWNR